MEVALQMLQAQLYFTLSRNTFSPRDIFVLDKDKMTNGLITGESLYFFTINAGDGKTNQWKYYLQTEQTVLSNYHLRRMVNNRLEISSSSGYEGKKYIGNSYFSLIRPFYLSEVTHTQDTIISLRNIVTFPIVASASEGGAIYPKNNVAVEYGKNQTFTFIPDKNYEIATVSVDGKNIGAVKSYTFDNVTEGHSISVIYKEKETMIKTMEATQRLSIYPNPTKGEIQIKDKSKIGTVQIFDVIGKLWYEVKNVNESETKIDISSFPNGIYFLKINERAIRVIKQ
jgi:hypothetical protein